MAKIPFKLPEHLHNPLPPAMLSLCCERYYADLLAFISTTYIQSWIVWYFILIFTKLHTKQLK
ncbi:hypothetical protein H744_2c1179 [Photobacterium gaetbulicola Gung47]|uniref:Uncharacterized protein n=1 Tax=Photobacterium gaetbulicola Gung47 TaxID=658445 RepID=A0A0C5WL10_9GAMM|nr:hypothetical protein H744_2c1179 [Photobacterium gaetbulicola Gung47]